ncbi:MAG: sensor histidine kinase, partial [Candidatus Binatia bacterium]
EPPAVSPNAIEHGKQRLRVGFNLEAVVREYGILRDVILEIFETSGGTMTPDELRILSQMISVGVMDAVREYSRARTRVLERFVGVLSHDLRDPLNTITLGADAILATGGMPEVVTNAARRIRRSTGRMRRHVEELLDVARAGFGGGFPLERRSTDLADVVRSVVEDAAAANPTRKIAFDDAGAHHGSWDPDRLAQVVANLVSNAIRYGSPTGTVTVRLGGDEDQAILEVHNEGEPITAGRLPRLFEAFEPHPDHDDAGLGLGLYIVREILRAHDGTIDVESSFEQGTTFRARLPRRIS